MRTVTEILHDLKETEKRLTLGLTIDDVDYVLPEVANLCGEAAAVLESKEEKIKWLETEIDINSARKGFSNW